MMNGKYSFAQIDQEIQEILHSLTQNHVEEIRKDLVYKPKSKNMHFHLYISPSIAQSRIQRK